MAVEGGHGAEVLALTAAKTLGTELAASQGALRERTELLATITDNAAEAIFLMDADGRVTFMNPAAERMFGWPREELLGRVLHDEVHYQTLGSNSLALPPRWASTYSHSCST